MDRQVAVVKDDNAVIALSPQSLVLLYCHGSSSIHSCIIIIIRVTNRTIIVIIRIQGTSLGPEMVDCTIIHITAEQDQRMELLEVSN
ncbi:hypothetical protein F2P81_013814 [Scophthalmus maximus]|uniref:Uncharacterized protein n=1 Tax=Scophthalmus maximus TaxID=52904 RepID=A0A6A4SNL0_SCOMX|nr:hypothetical protein F2P81_013814 [Scophthalmus maximus]